MRADIDYDLPNAGKYFRSVMEGFEHNDYETVMCNIFLVFTLTYCWWIMLHFGHSTFCRLLKRFWRTMFLCTWKTTTINLIYWCEFKFEFIILLFFGKSFIFLTSIMTFLLHCCFRFMLQKLYAIVDQTASPDNPDALQFQEALLPGHLITVFLKVTNSLVLCMFFFWKITPYHWKNVPYKSSLHYNYSSFKNGDLPFFLSTFISTFPWTSE